MLHLSEFYSTTAECLLCLVQRSTQVEDDAHLQRNFVLVKTEHQLGSL